MHLYSGDNYDDDSDLSTKQQISLLDRVLETF
jgi:hypothetical protein